MNAGRPFTDEEDNRTDRDLVFRMDAEKTEALTCWLQGHSHLESETNSCFLWFFLTGYDKRGSGHITLLGILGEEGVEGDIE